LSAPSYIKGAIFAVALKNILLAALVNQFSPTSYSQGLSIATAKIVSPPRGTIMLCNITCAEAISMFFAGGRVRAEFVRCRIFQCAEIARCRIVRRAEIARCKYSGVRKLCVG
jgi:hypothetical protein